MKYSRKLFHFGFVLLFSGLSGLFMSYDSGPAREPVRAMYATVWSINTPEKVDHLIETAQQYGFNQIFFQSRYRGDALYTPNRTDSTFRNTEKRCYVLQDSSFDPLAYAIEKANEAGIEIHAWVTVFVMTPHDLWKLDASHAYYTHPEWVTCKRDGTPMPNTEAEGAFFDPGVPAVKQYFTRVISDLVKNYDVAGVQFDYIRYPDSTYGFNPIAMQELEKSGAEDLIQWKRNQITTFVKQLSKQLKSIKPDLQISAAVIADQDKALNKYSQEWPKWIARHYVDKVYLMAYNTSNKSFTKLIAEVAKLKERKRMVIVLRAWPAGKPYPVSQINQKIEITRRYKFKNFGFYSYSGLVDNNYLPGIRFR